MTMKKSLGKLFCLSQGLALASFAFAVSGFADETAGNAPKEPAPGVMTTIRPFINYSETFQWSDIPEIAGAAEGEADHSFDWARNIYFSKEIWCLQFSFKPVRFMEVDFPNNQGKLDRKTVWYMVYSVTNTGQFVGCDISTPADNKTDIMVRDSADEPLKPEEVEQKANNLDGIYVIKNIDYLEGKYELKEVHAVEQKNAPRTVELQTIREGKVETAPAADGTVPGTVRFSPRFYLVSKNIAKDVEYVQDETGLFNSTGVNRTSAVWNDQFLPLAFAKIAAYEDSNRNFENSVSFPAIDIKPGETVWGIATWTDINPTVNNFTIYVSGLTNALRWTDSEAAFSVDNPPLGGRDITRKVLKLNFYRPGDDEVNNKNKVYFGVPGQKSFEWVYL